MTSRFVLGRPPRRHPAGWTAGRVSGLRWTARSRYTSGTSEVLTTWTVAKLEVEDLRWSRVVIAVAAGILGLLVLPPIYLFFLAAVIGFSG